MPSLFSSGSHAMSRGMKKPSVPPARRPGPRGNPLPLLLAVAVLLLGGGAVIRMLVVDRAVPAVGGPYALNDTDGKAVTEASFHGRLTLIYFGYTHCVDVCPLTLAVMTRALDLLGPRGRAVVPIFVTVDPAHDTPEVMREYIRRFSPRIVGLTANEAALRPVLDRFHIAVHPQPTQGDATGSQLIDHSSVLYLMDGDNHLLAVLPVETEPRALARQIARYLPAS
ncbi:cytochrome oxidase Cu insertion factor (SCO1/SenC/PrrC family) [Acidomonas methanolica]|nr:cytochrome oxidase Cu insertion factor (SCO1/SenC/PrrC family) [Acidomonas methanolica]